MLPLGAITDAIIAIVNQVLHHDGVDERMLAQVVRLIYEGAVDNPSSSETYARLCRGIVWGSESTACVVSSRNRPESFGGQLFHMYLVARCQKDFERGRSAAKASSASNVAEPQESPDRVGDTAFLQTRTRRIACVKFIGELFNQQLLTPSILNECLRRLPTNFDRASDEEIECSCMLLATAGRQLEKASSNLKTIVYLMSLSITRLGVSPYAHGIISVSRSFVIVRPSEGLIDGRMSSPCPPTGGMCTPQISRTSVPFMAC